MVHYEFKSVPHAPKHEFAVPNFYRAFFKRALDLVAVILLAIPALIVIFVFAAMIARDGRSPFYTQRRVGRFGREFKMLKLRSMVPDADTLLEAYLNENPEARKEWNEKQKLSFDPRITKIGQIIRKSSIDELPQIWNVLRGDMSLVGPRPMLPAQKGIYPGTCYFDLRPGITGLWQVSVRNEANFQQRAGYDNRYLSEVSFWTDVRVMVRTVAVVYEANGK